MKSSGGSGRRGVLVVAALACIATVVAAPGPALAAPAADAAVPGALDKPSLAQQWARWKAEATTRPRGLKPAERAATIAGSNVITPAVATACGVLPTLPSPPSGAPWDTFSRYVNGDHDLYAMGHAQGCTSDEQRNGAATLSQIAILDYGDASVNNNGKYGATDSNGFHRIGAIATVNTIEWSVMRYLQGFWDGTTTTSTSSMLVLVGTNNHKYSASGVDNGAPVNYNHGRAWALMVVDLNNWITAQGYGAQLHVDAAMDMEPSWSTYAQALDWANGFISVPNTHYYNFGSADGCPYATTPGECVAGPLSGGHMGWSSANIYNLSWGLTPAYAVPEIYVWPLQQQWYLISLAGVLAGHSKIYYSAALSEHDACGGCGEYTYYQSWSNLLSALNADSRTSIGSIPYATEMSWSNP